MRLILNRDILRSKSEALSSANAGTTNLRFSEARAFSHAICRRAASFANRNLPSNSTSANRRCARRFSISSARGWSIVIPRQGYRVSPVSLRDANEIFAFRQALELACIAEAVKNASG